MEVERWEVESGKMGSGEWKDGKWKVESGKMGSGKWRVESVGSGKWKN